MVIRTQNTFECDNPNCKKRDFTIIQGNFHFNAQHSHLFLIPEDCIPNNWVIDKDNNVFCSITCRENNHKSLE